MIIQPIKIAFDEEVNLCASGWCKRKVFRSAENGWQQQAKARAAIRL
jgi:hypothetical protein